MELLSDSFCSFGLKLMKDIVTDGQTIVLSPASITMCSSLVYLGTNGMTKQEMKGTMFPERTVDEELLEDLKKIEIALTKSGSNCSLSMANRVYYPSNYVIHETYSEKIQKYFNKCDLAKFNVQCDMEPIRQQINCWVKENTNSKIRDCLSVGILTPKNTLGLVVLSNSYFQNVWENCTTKQNVVFRPNATTEIKVEMIHTVGDNFKYTQNDQCQVLGIPFNDSELITFYILPHENIDLKKFENDLNGFGLIKLINSVFTSAVHAEIPLFTLQQRFSLAQNLKHIGITELFNGGGNFSAMVSNGTPSVSAIVHISYIENKISSKSILNEKRDSKKEPYTFIANRPFIFAVVEQTTMSFILLGHYFG